MKRGALQSAYRILVSSSPEKPDHEEGDIWDSRKVASGQALQIPYQGKPLESSTRYYWKVRTWDRDGRPSEFSETCWFETGLLDQDDWQGVWIRDHREPPEKDEDFYERIPVPLFRKEFLLDKEIEKARLYVSGLGYYEAYLNGGKAGDHRLDPGWTRYDKTVYYAAYDVTGHLKQGQNAAGIMLGNGWYNPLPMRLFGRWNLRKILTIGRPKVIAQLQVEYTDGSTEVVVTGPDWKTAEGPVVRNNVYLGEWQDARMEKEGWTLPGYAGKQWQQAREADPPGGRLTWQYIPPIRHTRTVYPLRVDVPEKGIYVVDMGQNFAGVIRFRVNAPEGTDIRFRYAELVNDDGTIDVNTTAATQIKKGGIQGGPGAPETAWQEDRYICKGEGTEVFEPKFTFNGFRYVEITGLPYKPSLNDIRGIRLNADLPGNASFRCSNRLFNSIQENTEWTMLSNVFSIESDCPAREKFGYGGDIVSVGEAYIYNFDMSNFYAKTVRDFARDALPYGAMTECAPNIGINGRGLTEESGPVGWTLAHPLLLEKLYRYYGNLELVREQYQPLKDLVDFYHRQMPDHIIMIGIGDHVSIDERPTPVTSTAFYYHHVTILGDMARLLGKPGDAEKYDALAGEIRKAFIDKFVNEETGEVYTHTQAAQVFALYYGLLPDGLERKALQVLRDEIFLKHHGHLSTGIFATKMMLNVLSDRGLDWINYTMMNQKEFPGYGYMIDNGATTLWENWSFKQHDSKNHPMFGSVSEWFHRSLLGIQQTENSVGFSDIVIKPAVVGGLTYAQGYYHSVRGKIESSWWKFGDDIFMDIGIPANTRATVYVPIAPKANPDIYEGDQLLIKGGQPAEMPPEIRFVRKTNNFVVLETGSGKYHFEARH